MPSFGELASGSVSHDFCGNIIVVRKSDKAEVVALNLRLSHSSSSEVVFSAIDKVKVEVIVSDTGGPEVIDHEASGSAKLSICNGSAGDNNKFIDVVLGHLNIERSAEFVCGLVQGKGGCVVTDSCLGVGDLPGVELVEPRGVGAQSAELVGTANPFASLVANLVSKIIGGHIASDVAHGLLEVIACALSGIFGGDKDTAHRFVKVPDVVLEHGVVVIGSNAGALDRVTANVHLTNTVFETAESGLLNVGVTFNPQLLTVDQGQVRHSHVVGDHGEQHPRVFVQISNG